MVCFKFRCIVMMSPFFVPGVLKLCDSAEVSTKNSSSSYGLPILRNQPNWCSNGGERIPMGSLFEITPCTYCVCNQEDTGTNAGDRHVPTIIAISLNFLALIHVVQFVVLVGIIITLAEFRIKYSEEKFKKCFIFLNWCKSYLNSRKIKWKKKLNQKK